MKQSIRIRPLPVAMASAAPSTPVFAARESRLGSNDDRQALA